MQFIFIHLLSFCLIAGSKYSAYSFVVASLASMANFILNKDIKVKLNIHNSIYLSLLFLGLVFFALEIPNLTIYSNGFLNEILNGLNLFILITQLFYRNFKKVFSNFIQIFFYWVSVYALMSLFKAFYIVVEFEFLDSFIKSKINLFSLRQDYNYHSLLCIVGVLLLEHVRIDKKLKAACFFLFSINSLLCFSRRGFIIYCLVLGYLTVRRWSPTKITKKVIGFFLVTFATFFTLNLVIKTFNEQLVYKRYKNNIVYSRVYPNFAHWSKQLNGIDRTKLDNSSRQRIHRLETALELIKESDARTIVFGEGLSYLKFFSEKKGRFDYPHNFILSSLFLGGLSYLLLTLFFIFYIPIVYLKSSFLRPLLRGEFVLIFLALLGFSLTSYNTIFMNSMLISLLLIGGEYLKVVPVENKNDCKV